MESCGPLMRFSFLSIVCWMAAVLCAVLSTGRLWRWAGAGLPVVLAAGGTRAWVGTEVRAVCQPCPAVARTLLTDLCGLRFSLVYRVGVWRLWVWLRGSETRSWCCNWTEVGGVRPPSLPPGCGEVPQGEARVRQFGSVWVLVRELGLEAIQVLL